MKITFPTQHERHSQTKEVFNWSIEPASEISSRIEIIKNQLIHDYSDKINLVLIESNGNREDSVSQIHTKEYLNFLRSRENILQLWEESFWNDFWYGNGSSAAENAVRWIHVRDTYTAFTKNIFDVAMRSYNAVHTAWEYVLNGEKLAYALTRPPGHHAMKDSASWYCYLANASIFANHLKQQWIKAGILDIDFHHWNGAQIIFYNDPSVITTSIHADPNRKFPYFSGNANENGTGKWYGKNLNIPLEAWINTNAYLKHLAQSCEFLQKEKVEFLIVCAWFDTYEKDPISDFKISLEWFALLGKMIKDLWLPTLFIQEGGYNTGDLWKCVSSFFSKII